jgi:leucyl-tRNA synthetase
MTERYNHQETDKKWQEIWEKDQIYFAKDNSGKPKKLVLIEFPYPSGDGLHMGHLRPYLAGDVYSRFLRMNGNEVMYPIGWDAFGLPAENYAIKNKVHPSVSTAKNVATAKGQLKRWGTGFDWGREINTTDPQYYKWTQWIFLQFFKKGLAYEATGLINWCPKDKTGLANEEVVDGKCERCGTEVEKKELRQWYLKITDYAEKLLEGLKTLDWADRIKLQQENWIGKSEGAEINFKIDEVQKVKRAILLHGRAGDPNKNYHPWLKKELENLGIETHTPKMPSVDNEPDDIEQADFIQNNYQLDEQTVIVGHSFGAIVALRLLERGIKVNGVVLVATPYSGKFTDGQTRASVTVAAKKGFDFETIKKNAQYFEVLSDLTDDIVPTTDGEELARRLGVKLTTGTASQPHFCGNQEPVVLDSLIPQIKVFTTRPDTIFGATYMVLAPEHPLVGQITTADKRTEVLAYMEKSKAKSEQDRTNAEKEKTGVFTGAYAINPATKEKVPVWIADYVLANYGTGAIMAVPAHDERDKEFAEKFNLPIKEVLDVNNNLINSGSYDGLPWKEAKKKLTQDFGSAKVQYKLRDWVFSRQRYWGEPIPLVHCAKCGIVAVPDDQLPVRLPEVKEYEPTGTGESPLAAISDWVNTTCPNCSGPAKRETNTMPQWAGSSWYWRRYSDIHNDKEFADKEELKYWQPVDVYFGGMEHTTLHLLYSRFWNQFMYDQGLVTVSEPYVKRIPHGIILAADGEKMSKSRGNVVNPDSVIEQDGADTLRMHEMFLGPHEATVSWNDKGLVGIKRFLDKVWRFEPDDSAQPNNAIHSLIDKVSNDISAFKFNTAIAAFMEFLNDNKALNKSDWEMFLKLLATFAPHMTEEIWHRLGHAHSIHVQEWPKADASKTKKQVTTITIQVNGKLRGTIEVAPGTSQDEVRKLVMSDPNITKHTEGKELVKEIFVQDKLINFVVK